MSEPASGDNILHTCNICKETYDTLANFTEHNKIHVNVEKETDKTEKKTKKTRRRKKKQNKFCNICRKTFASAGSCYVHMKNYHGESTTYEYVPFKKSLPTSTPKDIEKTNQNVCKVVSIEDIFIEFENELPLELRCDKRRCIMCGTVFKDMKDYVNHEKIHYQVEVQNPMDEITTLNADNNAALDTIICSMCQRLFATNVDYEEHKKNINCQSIEQTAPIVDGANIPKEQQKEVDKIVNDLPKVIVVQNSKGVQNDEHINACKELYIVKEHFYCNICKQTCDKPEHLEINQWWTPPPNLHQFTCTVCLQTFSDKNSWKLHEAEHVKTNI